MIAQVRSRREIPLGENRADGAFYAPGVLERGLEACEARVAREVLARDRAVRAAHVRAVRDAQRCATPSLVMVGIGASHALEGDNLNALLVGRTGRRLLLDCGYTAKRALARAGVAIADVEAVFLTHCHADHVYGLERFAYETKIAGLPRPRLYGDPRTLDRAWHRCLRGTCSPMAEGAMTLESFFEPVPCSGAFEFDGVVCEPFEVEHTPGVVAHGLALDAGRCLYTGDTLPIPRVIARLRPAVVLHDCLVYTQTPVHALLSSLLGAYPASTLERLWIMGYEDDAPARCRSARSRIGGVALAGQRFTWLMP